MDISNLSKMEKKVSRSISAENYTGEKGGGARTELKDGIHGHMASNLGKGWKVNPHALIQPGEEFTLADISGSGIIEHIWLTPLLKWRNAIIRMYWDDQEIPSVECPCGDFFCMGWNCYAQLSSLAVCVDPGSGCNCYWPMPFRKRAKITMENRGDEPLIMFYQIDYCLCEVAEDEAYFHAQFRRVNPVPYKTVYTVLDGVKGKGKYVGTYFAWASHDNGWWGEGEMKFYMDGDQEYPTICGTGVEDYIGGSYDFRDPYTKKNYVPFTTPYSGLHQVIVPDQLYACQIRFGMYRWHIPDPIYFEKDLRVTVHDLGIYNGKYNARQDDIASVAYWYQQLPTAPFPKLPDREYLEIIN